MNQVFSRDGWRALASAWIVLVLAIAAAASIGLGTQWYRDRERRESRSAAQRLQEANARVQGARRERDSLEESADVFRKLMERGLLQTEQRLNLVEMMNGLRVRHQLFTFDYEIAPQRALALPGGRVYPSVDVLASRVKIRLRALHEGDIVGFLEDLARAPQGIYVVDRCRIRRVEATVSQMLSPRVEAECGLEWITLKDKHVNANNRPS